MSCRRARPYFPCVLLYFLSTYLTHRTINAVAEGLNAKIQWSKYSSCGFPDRERFKLTIYSHCGGLDLDRAAEKLLSAQPSQTTARPETRPYGLRCELGSHERRLISEPLPRRSVPILSR